MLGYIEVALWLISGVILAPYVARVLERDKNYKLDRNEFIFFAVMGPIPFVGGLICWFFILGFMLIAAGIGILIGKILKIFK